MPEFTINQSVLQGGVNGPVQSVLPTPPNADAEDQLQSLPQVVSAQHGIVAKPAGRVGVAVHLVDNDIHGVQAGDKFRRDSGKVFVFGGSQAGAAGQLYWFNVSFESSLWYQFTNNVNGATLNLASPFEIQSALESPFYVVNTVLPGSPLLNKKYSVLYVTYPKNTTWNADLFNWDQTLGFSKFFSTHQEGLGLVGIRREEVESLTNKQKFQLYFLDHFGLDSPSSAYNQISEGEYETGLESRAFQDHACTISTPLFKKEVNNSFTLHDPIYANVLPQYNYFLETYEASAQITPTPILPNLYIFRSEMKNEKLFSKAYDEPDHGGGAGTIII